MDDIVGQEEQGGGENQAEPEGGGPHDLGEGAHEDATVEHNIVEIDSGWEVQQE